jgi:ABC-type nickel/cobalt efflux system permease component RcnA
MTWPHLIGALILTAFAALTLLHQHRTPHPSRTEHSHGPHHRPQHLSEEDHQRAEDGREEDHHRP